MSRIQIVPNYDKKFASLDSPEFTGTPTVNGILIENGVSVIDNGDGTITVSGPGVIDNGNGTFSFATV